MRRWTARAAAYARMLEIGALKIEPAGAAEHAAALGLGHGLACLLQHAVQGSQKNRVSR